MKEMKNQIRRVITPCNKCPYKIGIIKTVTNPCPQCKLNKYKRFKVLKKQLAEENSENKN